MELPLSLTLTHLALLVLGMGFAWYLLSKWHRRGHVDLLWSLAIAAQAISYATQSGGWLPRRLLFAGLAVVWGLRLAFHLAQRLSRDGEDGRYLAMEAAAGDRAAPFFFGFFQLQALAAWTFALPFAYLVQDAAPGFRVWELLGVALWLLALFGNSMADRQLDRWRKDPGNHGRTCRVGLWAWSRHPNYFFEWLLWCAYPVAAVGTATFLPQVGLAALMFLMVTRVSGIPFTEQQAIRTRGDDYRAYQASTSSFFPRPPRHVPEHPSR